ncbi:unnamed protein product [Bemisia tabaci]|uniref:Uncharacterized protein n=1 Tax=Bemisia tabaci TaxID=7038 RepID=A0A9P0A6N3_BEMTA|nr:unnamed protein product [Bemisia tabaci]
MSNPGPPVSVRNSSLPQNVNASRNPWTGPSYQQMVTSNYYEPECSSPSSENGSRIYHVIDGPGPPINYDANGTKPASSKIRKQPAPVQNHHLVPHPQGVTTMKKLPPLEQLPRMPHLQASHDSVRGPPQFYTRDSFPRHFRPPSQGDYLEEIRPQPPFYNVGSGRTSRATLDVPLSSTTSDDDGGGIDACGGHCVAFENFCHYCLQVIFIAGILTGISLMIAGSILIGQRGNDDNHSDYIYIGCLMMLVCTLLLSVQCCVRRNVKRRKRALRRQATRRRPSSAHTYNDRIPLNDISPPSSTIREISLPSSTTRDIYPVNGQLSALNTQNISVHDKLNSTMDSSASQSGIPWWRRQEFEDLMHQHNFV